MPPTPKRSSERRRRNVESRPDKIEVAGRVRVPAADRDWHPIAQRWYRSLKTSGQSQFFEPSDWASAMFVAEAMSRQLLAERPSAQMFASVWTAMTDLLCTEASRRKVRIELERVTGGPPKADVTALDDYRRQLAGG